MKVKKSNRWASILLALTMFLMIFSPIPAFADDHHDTIEIYTFNDFHGALAEDVREGRNAGMAKMITAARLLRAENPHTIFLSAGDSYQGSAMSNLTYGDTVSMMIKAMGVTASAVGNHEFDWGISHIERWAKDGDITFLASNIYDKASNKPVEWAQPYMFVEEMGIKIALIGLAHQDTAVLTKAEFVEDVDFKDPAEYAQIWIDYLKAGKAEEGIPDVIIALTHVDSYQNKDTKVITGTAATIAEKVTGLDAIISAHSHQEVAGFVNDVAIIQAHSVGRMLGRLSLKVVDGKVTEILPSLDKLGVRKIDIVADADALEMFTTAQAKVAPILNEVIGQADGVFTHTTRDIPNVSVLGKWAAEVMRERTGVQVAIQNGGGLRRTLESGTITMGDLYEIMPFDNQLVTMELPGADLIKAIDHGIMNPNIGDGQFSGLKVVYDKDKEWTNRIVSITLEDGTPIDPNAFYSVVVNDFMYTGGDSYNFKNARNVVDTYIPVRDILVAAIKEAGTIVASAPDYVIEKSDVVVEAEKYTVVAGDVLWRIARKFQTTWQKIAELNEIKNPNLIFPGQIFMIPLAE